MLTEISYYSWEWFRNHTAPTKAPGVPGGFIQHLSIKRLDQETVHDWREMQRIKSALCGEHREGVELHPDERRLVDTSNQYHLWVLPEGMEFPFGYGGRAVSETEALGNKQRPFEDPPPDLISEERMQDFLNKDLANENDDENDDENNDENNSEDQK